MTSPNKSSSLDSQFWSALTAELLEDSRRFELANFDHLRFKRPFSPRKQTKDFVLAVAAALGFYRAFPVDREMFDLDLPLTYQLLDDRQSRELFLKLVVFRILGHQRVRLPRNTADYWRSRRSVTDYVEKRNAIANVPILKSLDLYVIEGIRLYAHSLTILNTLLLEQYRCSRAAIGVGAGDVVIDAGGCWADTALYFARRAAQVFCFECAPQNLAIAQKNLAMNPHLSPKVELIQKALWSSRGGTLSFDDNGPASRTVKDEPAGLHVNTESIDGFVSSRDMERLDFIKMDIEGAELEALQGAEGSIRRFRPQLAISIYHSPDHLVSIPTWLHRLSLGYRFYLEHFTIHREETVLFARAMA